MPPPASINNKIWKISLEFYKNSSVINNECSYKSGCYIFLSLTDDLNRNGRITTFNRSTAYRMSVFIVCFFVRNYIRTV